MTTYYVGSGGSDANDGLTWATRKLTLNGAEDIPVVAGDTVYVAPGVYRELLTLDVSGSSGNLITYIGDVTGINTDGVGGYVRITGSNNDTTTNRLNCISGTRDYRKFVGFTFDTTSNIGVTITSEAIGIVIEYCSFSSHNTASISLTNPLDCTVRSCFFMGSAGPAILLTNTTLSDNRNCLIENCYFIQGNQAGIQITRIGGTIIRNCTFLTSNPAIRSTVTLTAGQFTSVYGCIFSSCGVGMQSNSSADFIENYNTLHACSSPRSLVTAGANSVANPPFLASSIYEPGYIDRLNLLELDSFSTVRAFTNPQSATTDLYGLTRPTTSGKTSLGATQHTQSSLETSQTYSGSGSLSLLDAGRVQFRVPVNNVSTTLSVQVKWETDYAGTKPQMIIKQPGQADITVTATGGAGSWELLTHTWTPSTATDFIVVDLVSSNTATSGSYKTYFDDLSSSVQINSGEFNHWFTDRLLFETINPKSGKTGDFNRWITNEKTFPGILESTYVPAPEGGTIPILMHYYRRRRTQ